MASEVPEGKHMRSYNSDDFHQTQDEVTGIMMIDLELNEGIIPDVVTKALGRKPRVLGVVPEGHADSQAFFFDTLGWSKDNSVVEPGIFNEWMRCTFIWL